jgi:Glycosyl hydrolases family 18
MSSETFINYWIGQEPNPPSPTLDQMPAYVNIVPLAFVAINDDYTLKVNGTLLTEQFPAATIQGWVKTVQANGTKVLFSILDHKLGSIPANKVDTFVQSVADNVQEWGVDGLDFDYEPPSNTTTLVPLVQSLRQALPNSTFTAPIYYPWTFYPDLLAQYAAELDFVSTMDYTPYPGFGDTISYCEQYAKIIGGWSKLVIGMSCMGPSDSGNFTPYDDVISLAKYEPSTGGPKGGAMLYTFSYDVTTRNDGTTGTGYPDGTWTELIHDNLP